MNYFTILQYESDGYPQRIYQDSGTLTNVTTNRTLYLLKSTEGIYVTFQVINKIEQGIPGVKVVATRKISGSEVIVGSGYTGADGGVTFWLNPDEEHTFFFSKEGYNNYTTSLYPTQSSYTIQLSTGITEEIKNYIRGISYYIYPKNTYLQNDTVYNFNFTIVTSYWSLEEFGFNLTDEDGNLLDEVSSSSDIGGTVGVDLNTGNNERIVMTYYWIINGTSSQGKASWIVLDMSENGYSIKRFVDDFVSYIGAGLFGMDEFGVGLILFFIVFVFAGVMSLQFGMTSPVSVVSIIFALVMFFDVGIGLLPNPIGAVPHFPTIFVALILIGVLIKEGTQ